MTNAATNSTTKFAIATMDLFGVWSRTCSAIYSDRRNAVLQANFIRNECITGGSIFPGRRCTIKRVLIVDAKVAPMRWGTK